MREALAGFEGTQLRYAEYQVLGTLAAFLRSRDRDEEAEPLERRRAELLSMEPATAAE